MVSNYIHVTFSVDLRNTKREDTVSALTALVLWRTKSHKHITNMKCESGRTEGTVPPPKL